MAAQGGIAAIVTAAGSSRRLWPVTKLIPKAFLPIAVAAGELEYPLRRLVRQLQALDADRIVIAGNGHPWFDELATAEPLLEVVTCSGGGEWEAVSRVAALFRDEPPELVLVLSCDNVVADGALAEVVEAAHDARGASVGVGFAEDSRELCRVELGGEGRLVVGLTEKPPDGRRGYAKSGIYGFLGTCFGEIASIPPEPDRFGERSLTGTLQYLLDTGRNVRAVKLPGGFVDIGTPGGLEAAVALSGRRRAAKDDTAEKHDTAEEGG